MTDALAHQTGPRPPVPPLAVQAPRAPVLLRTPADVVAAVPYLLGHHPARCLVAIGRHRDVGLGVVCRVDLPELGATRAISGAVVQALLADGAESALLLVYDDVDPPLPLGPAAAAVLVDVCDALALAGLEVYDALRVGPSRWRSVDCTVESCCPAGGHPLAESRTRPVAVGFVVDGHSPAPDRQSLEPDLARAPLPARRSASAAVSRWRRGGGAAHDLSARAAVLRQWVAAVDDHRRVGTLPVPSLIGRLAAAWADDPRLRDACMVALVPGSGLLPDSLLAGAPADLQPLLGDRACAGAVVVVAPVLRHMAAHLTGDARAAVLALHAWLAWASGSGAAAADLAERALAAQPGHRLASLVAQLLDRAVGPDWVTGPAVPS